MKKVKKNWGHELKRASIYLRKRKASSQEASTIGMADLEPIRWATIPSQCRQLSDQVTALFESHHARRYARISFEIEILRSMGVSVATSKFSVHCPLDIKPDVVLRQWLNIGHGTFTFENLFVRPL